MTPPWSELPPFLSATIKIDEGYFNDFIPAMTISKPDQIQVWVRRSVDVNPVDWTAWFYRRQVRLDELRLKLL